MGTPSLSSISAHPALICLRRWQAVKRVAGLAGCRGGGLSFTSPTPPATTAGGGAPPGWAAQPGGGFRQGWHRRHCRHCWHARQGRQGCPGPGGQGGRSPILTATTTIPPRHHAASRDAPADKTGQGARFQAEGQAYRAAQDGSDRPAGQGRRAQLGIGIGSGRVGGR